MADHSKLTRQAPVCIAGLAELDGWIADAAPPPGLRARMAAAKSDLIMA